MYFGRIGVAWMGTRRSSSKVNEMISGSPARLSG